jgi:alpha-tubulin suppressor-like RCC1 family protein
MRRGSVALLLLLSFGVWSAWLAFQHRHFAPSFVATPDPPFCPRDGNNPPHRLPAIHDAVSISFDGSRLVAVDREGNVWSHYRGESRCDDPAPIMVLAAATVKTLYPTAGRPRIVQRRAVLMNGQALISVGLDFKDPCQVKGQDCRPLHIVNRDEITALASGDNHMLVVRKDGSLWSSGMNDCGQLGREGQSAYPDYFKQVPGMSGIVAVASGMRSSMALDGEGKVFTWGNLSNPLFASTTSPPVPGYSYCPYQDFEWAGHRLSGRSDDYPREIQRLPRIQQIASYYATDVALDVEGHVWGWGFNSCGQLGLNPGKGSGRLEYYVESPRKIDGLPPIRAIAAGKRHVLALDGEGHVWAWGEGTDTQLGSRLDLEGSPACENEYGRGDSAGFAATPRQVPGIGKAVAIAAGFNSSAAIDEHGDVWVWGRH